MIYGSTIGKKFYEDGRVRTYPGNTVVADITPGCSAYDVMIRLREMLLEAKLEDHYIPLPTDSYHMTVISGLNDQVRKDTHWPPQLPKTTPMTQVDDYISAAIARAGIPGPLRMKFDKAHVSSGCFIIHLLPADGTQEEIALSFRERAAKEIGFKLPNHDGYRFHVSLAYTRIVPEGEAAERLEQLQADMNALLADQPEFTTGVPYMAYYKDMYAFSPDRIPRDGTVYATAQLR